MLSFANLVEGKVAMLEILREWRNQQSLKPLIDYRLALGANPKAFEELRCLSVLSKMLGTRLDESSMEGGPRSPEPKLGNG